MRLRLQFCVGIIWWSCENAGSDSAGLGWSLRVRISSMLAGYTDAVGPGTVLSNKTQVAESESAFSQDPHMIPSQNWSLSHTALQHHSGSRLETQRTRNEEAEKSLWSWKLEQLQFPPPTCHTLRFIFWEHWTNCLQLPNTRYTSLFVSSLSGRFFPLHFTRPRLLLENLFWTFCGQAPFLWVSSPSSVYPANPVPTLNQTCNCWHVWFPQENLSTFLASPTR